MEQTRQLESVNLESANLTFKSTSYCNICSRQFCFNCVAFQVYHLLVWYGPRHEKTCLRGFANNKGGDQPAYPRSLISAFAIHFVEKYYI